MTNEAPILEWPLKDPVSWPRVYELLNTAQYESAAALLQEAQQESEYREQLILADILAAVRGICLACSQCKAEVVWLGRAREEAERRESELKQQLYDILNIFSKNEAAESWEQRATPPAAPPVALRPPEFDQPQATGRPSLWQQVRSLLGQRPEKPVVVVEAVTSPPPETLGTLSIPAVEEVEEPKIPLVEEAEGMAGFPAEEPQRVISTVEQIETPMLSSIRETEGPAFPSVEQVEEPIPSPPGETEMPTPPAKDEEQRSPMLIVYCFGFFQVYQDEQPIQDWKSSKGKAIFKYLIAHRGVPIAKEVLMDLFWPDSTPEAARNNLNVAIYGLRQSLRQTRPDLSHILFQDDHYLLKPELQIWVDVEAFMEHYRMAQNLEQSGELALAIPKYRAAEALYQGEFLADDRYEDWLIPRRQQLEADCLHLLDRLSRYYLEQEDYDACVIVCKKMLTVDPCREEAHCRLMRCYSQQNQRYLALRQYHLCIESLANELDVGPSQTTIDLYEQLRRA